MTLASYSLKVSLCNVSSSSHCKNNCLNQKVVSMFFFPEFYLFINSFTYLFILTNIFYTGESITLAIFN